MPVTFSTNHEDGYFVSKFKETISVEELLHNYRDYFLGGEWIPGLNELVDMSDADMREITTEGTERIVALYESLLKTHKILSVKTAVYAPEDLPFGISRMYSMIAEISESPENVAVFRNFLEAKEWLKKNKK